MLAILGCYPFIGAVVCTLRELFLRDVMNNLLRMRKSFREELANVREENAPDIDAEKREQAAAAEAATCKFHFLRADYIRNLPDQLPDGSNFRLPRFQDIMREAPEEQKFVPAALV